MLMWLLQLLGPCALPVSKGSGAPNSAKLGEEHLKGGFAPKRSATAQRQRNQAMFLCTKRQLGNGDNIKPNHHSLMEDKEDVSEFGIQTHNLPTIKQRLPPRQPTCLALSAQRETTGLLI